ncbi:MAG: FAD-dependent oxidoreductase [Blastocatellia bacterium]|nr:FAD-dependent oxidoreductase [Blastocatellia bacterium]
MKDSRKIHVVCIGGGPAGLATALWCRDLGLEVSILERASTPGGQLGIIYNQITNYLGAETVDGAGLRDIFLKQLGDASKYIRPESEAVSINPDPLSVCLATGEVLGCDAIIIATGVRRRTLGVAGEKEFAERGVLRSGAASCDEMFGKNVVIVGGGDAAVENALMLSEKAHKITLVHRRAHLTARADFVEQATNSKIDFRLSSVVTEIIGQERVSGVAISRSDGDTKVIEADAVLVRAGWQPNSELVARDVDIDESGYIIADAEGRTSLANVYAIGDVRRPLSPTIAAAVGDAASAIKAIVAARSAR